MTNAGWYPDPAGSPGAYRYWDGQQWSEQTSTDPYGAASGATQQPGQPPAPPAPPASAATQMPGQQPYQPQPYSSGQPYQQPYQSGQPQWAGGASSGGSSGGKGKTIGIIIAAVLVLVLIGVAAFFGVRALSGDDEPDEPTPSGSTEGGSTEGGEGGDGTDYSTVQPTAEQCDGGLPTVGRPQGGDTITGGGLEMPTLADEGYTVEQDYAEGFTFAEQFTPIYRVIEQTDTSGWVSTAGVGGLLKRNGFESPEQAAEIVMTCTAANPLLYSNVSDRTDVDRGAITVDGADAFQVTAEVRVDQPDLQTEGDVVQVVVVDTGDDRTFGLFISAMPIGDDELAAVQEELLDELELED